MTVKSVNKLFSAYQIDPKRGEYDLANPGAL